MHSDAHNREHTMTTLPQDTALTTDQRNRALAAMSKIGRAHV